MQAHKHNHRLTGQYSIPSTTVPSLVEREAIYFDSKDQAYVARNTGHRKFSPETSKLIKSQWERRVRMQKFIRRVVIPALILGALALLMVGCVEGGAPVKAGSDLFVFPDTTRGVVCYSLARAGNSAPLSCVKVR